MESIKSLSQNSANAVNTNDQCVTQDSAAQPAGKLAGKLAGKKVSSVKNVTQNIPAKALNTPDRDLSKYRPSKTVRRLYMLAGVGGGASLGAVSGVLVGAGAGALVGLLAGPVGSAVGAVLGALVGGIAGAATGTVVGGGLALKRTLRLPREKAARELVKANRELEKSQNELKKMFKRIDRSLTALKSEFSFRGELDLNERIDIEQERTEHLKAELGFLKSNLEDVHGQMTTKEAELNRLRRSRNDYQCKKNKSSMLMAQRGFRNNFCERQTFRYITDYQDEQIKILNEKINAEMEKLKMDTDYQELRTRERELSNQINADKLQLEGQPAREQALHKHALLLKQKDKLMRKVKLQGEAFARLRDNYQSAGITPILKDEKYL